jgi:hypothetical protein
MKKIRFRIINPVVKVNQIDSYNSITNQVKDFAIKAISYTDAVNILEEMYGYRLVDCRIIPDIEIDSFLDWYVGITAIKFVSRLRRAIQLDEQLGL